MSHMSPNYCHIWHWDIINKGCGLIIILHIVKQLELVVSELWVLEIQSLWEEIFLSAARKTCLL